MDRLTHTALGAMQLLSQRQAQVAHNLANTATPGFRGDLLSAAARYLSAPGMSARAATAGGIAGIDLSAGAITATGRPLDVAMAGDALLAVDDGGGGEAYSRRGDLSIAATGMLENGDGRLVLGAGGPISVPPHDSIRIADNGGVWITPAGGEGQEVEIARLRLATPGGTALVKGMDGLIRVPDGGVLPPDEAARLIPASIEGSNVTATDALVDMIAASRGYETQVRLISTARELDESGARLMRLDG